jgi:hypothetical protein
MTVELSCASRRRAHERELLDAFDARQPAAVGRYLDALEAQDAA